MASNQQIRSNEQIIKQIEESKMHLDEKSIFDDTTEPETGTRDTKLTQHLQDDSRQSQILPGFARPRAPMENVDEDDEDEFCDTFVSQKEVLNTTKIDQIKSLFEGAEKNVQDPSFQICKESFMIKTQHRQNTNSQIQQQASSPIKTQSNSASNQGSSQLTKSLSKIVMGYDYVEKLKNLDEKRGNQQLISYFCQVGMHDQDILSTLMTVKEMISCGYGLNCFQDDDIVHNSDILTGKRPFHKNMPDKRFQVPIFQPKVISRVPSIDRCKFHFPLNLADFIYPKGVRVLSKQEVNRMKKKNKDCTSKIYDKAPMINPISHLMAENNQMQRELTLTNQEGVIYHATCYEYFIDLSHIEKEFYDNGYFKKYKENSALDPEGYYRILIPDERYFLAYNMCIISPNSYKHQFLRILHQLHHKFTKEKKITCLELEQVVNRIVFGIKSPKQFFCEFDILGSGKGPFRQKDQIFETVQVDLCEKVFNPIFFKEANHFDQQNTQFENVWFLIENLRPEIILTLFKRLIFSTCNIMISNDPNKLKKCILGMIELFYPLTCDVIVIPNLPVSMLEYVSICSQSLIGVCIDLKSQKSQVDDDGDNWSNEKSTRENQQKFYDILQDNSCMINIDMNQPEQKPKQLIGFNAKGNLSEGQGASRNLQIGQAQRMNKQYQNHSNQFQNNNDQFINQNFQNIELPNNFVVRLQDVIKDAKKKLGLKKEFIKLSKLLTQQIDANQQSNNTSETTPEIEKLKRELFHIQTRMTLKIYQVKYEFYLLTRKIIQCFTTDKMLGVVPKKGCYSSGQYFRGKDSESGHMALYLKWYARRDISVLIDKKHFKTEALNYDRQPLYRDPFYQRLLQHTSIQNFLTQKYFPCSLEENIRQFHALENVQLYDFSQEWEETTTKKKKKQMRDKSDIVFNQLQKYAYTPNQQASIRLFEDTEAESFPNNFDKLLEKRIDEDLLKIQNRSAFSMPNTQLITKKKTKIYFPRCLNDEIVREDFTNSENYKNLKSLQEDTSQEDFQNMLDYQPSPTQSHYISSNLSVIKNKKYRMTNFFEDKQPRDNIVITWILVFLGSLEYQFSPFKDCPESQFQLEKILAKDLAIALKMLIYKFSYEFNPKCHLLSLLFEYTHKYYFLHQVLIDIVFQDIDQRQGSNSTNGNSTVSDSFVIYQLHWQTPQVIDRKSGAQSQFMQNMINQSEQLALSQDKLMNRIPQQEWSYDPRRTMILNELAKHDEQQKNLQKEKRDRQLDEFADENSLGNSSDFPLKRRERSRGLINYISKLSPFKKGSKKEKRNLQKIGETSKIDEELQEQLDLYLELSNQDNLESQSVNSRPLELKITKSLNDAQQMSKKAIQQDNISKARSFWSTQQIQNGTVEEVQSEFAEISLSGSSAPSLEHFQTKIELVDRMCCKCKKPTTMGINPALDNIYCDKGCLGQNNYDNKIEAKLKVSVQSHLVSTNIHPQGIDVIHPKKLRSETEIMLMMGQEQSLIHSIDLCALSQDPEEQSYYWNLIYWFGKLKLPSRWLAPYIRDLQIHHQDKIFAGSFFIDQNKNNSSNFWQSVSQIVHTDQKQVDNFYRKNSLANSQQRDSSDKQAFKSQIENVQDLSPMKKLQIAKDMRKKMIEKRNFEREPSISSSKPDPSSLFAKSLVSP